MRIAIVTPLSAFFNDIADVVRLFYGEGAAVKPEEAADARLLHHHALEEGLWRESFTLTGEGAREEAQLSAPAVSGRAGRKAPAQAAHQALLLSGFEGPHRPAARMGIPDGDTAHKALLSAA